FGWPCSRPATKVDGADTKMTRPLSSSYPSQVLPPAVEISPENRREKLGFARNFAGFVLRRPAAIFSDQGRLCQNFGRKSRALTLLRERGYSFQKWARHQGDVRNSTGFVSGSGKFGAGPL
ncbi:unnamed protein product, partial [Prunus brigantina]